MTFAGRRSLLTFLLLASVLVACASTPEVAAVRSAPAPAAPRSATLVLGSVSNDPAEEVAAFQPFADSLAARLAPAGMTRVQVRVAASVAEMTKMLQRGEVDLYVDSPFPALAAAKGAGGTPFLKRWKEGVGDYHSVVFVKRSSAIRSAADLVGKRIAFDHEYSTSGYFLPKAALAERGVRLALLPGDTGPVPAGHAGFVFTEDEENTFHWVQKGRADAGAMSEQDLSELAGEELDSFRVLVKSRSVPRHVVVHRRGLEPERVEAVRGALLRMSEDPDGREVLEDFQETTRFEVLREESLEGLMQLMDRVAVDYDLG